MTAFSNRFSYEQNRRSGAIPKVPLEPNSQQLHASSGELGQGGGATLIIGVGKQLSALFAWSARETEEFMTAMTNREGDTVVWGEEPGFKDVSACYWRLAAPLLTLKMSGDEWLVSPLSSGRMSVSFTASISDWIAWIQAGVANLRGLSDGVCRVGDDGWGGGGGVSWNFIDLKGFRVFISPCIGVLISSHWLIHKWICHLWLHGALLRGQGRPRLRCLCLWGTMSVCINCCKETLAHSGGKIIKGTKSFALCVTPTLPFSLFSSWWIY